MTAILGISAYYRVTTPQPPWLWMVASSPPRRRNDSRARSTTTSFPSKRSTIAWQRQVSRRRIWTGSASTTSPSLKFERLLETYLGYASAGLASFKMALPLWLRTKLFLPRLMAGELGGDYKRRFVFTEHHESHAASCAVLSVALWKKPPSSHSTAWANGPPRASARAAGTRSS